jgi:hypothetical protein
MDKKTPKKTKEISHDDLVKYYREGEDVDNPIYAEQRSNLMLVAGNHYSKKSSRFYNRVRNDQNMAKEQKIRITKNHLQRICKIYENNILSYAPCTVIDPKNESELKDQKAAELNKSVWTDICTRHKMKQKTREIVQDFVRIGETHMKVYWDPNKGKFLGMVPRPMSMDDMPEPEDMEFDEDGNPVMPEQEMIPQFSGDIVYERIYGFNLFRAREAKNLDESWFVGLRKMMSVSDLKMIVGDDEEKVSYIQPSKDETYLVFDGNNTNYTEATNECLVLEFYIRPCFDFPNGYFYVYTLTGILWEGELPFGFFPIISAGFDEVPTNPRCHSIIKQLRPYQSELNRMASAAAETQITIGQDKVFIQAGTKLQNGGQQPGVNAYTVAGAAPTILPGRTGDQWFAPIKDCIDEMYLVANIAEDNQEKQSQADPYTMLFASIEQKKKYVLYVTKVMQFLVDMTDLSLNIAKNYYSDEAIIPMIGRTEAVNIAEFKTTTPSNFSIKIEEGTEDMESRMGRQLMFNHILQYASSKLDPKQLGQLIRMAPYANSELGFEDLTLDYDNATNMILSLDRGVYMPPNMQDDPQYMMKRLVARTRKADFNQLPPQVKDLYGQAYQSYIEINAKQQQAIKDAEQGLIPMSGMAVVCDLYVPMPDNPTKTQRARVPYDSLVWLLQAIEKQGMSQHALAQQQTGALADIARQMQQNPQTMQVHTPNGMAAPSSPAAQPQPHLPPTQVQRPQPQQAGGPGQAMQPAVNPAG